MKNFKRIIIFLVIAFVICQAVLLVNPGIRFTVKSQAVTLYNKITQSSEMKEVSTAKPDFTEVLLKDLLRSEKCKYNQSLMLINGSHPLPDGFEAEITQFEDTEAMMNKCAVDSFSVLRKTVTEKFGTKLLIMSAYRSNDEQAEIYEQDSEGVAAKAGESEHETGLGIDVYVKYYAGKGFLKSEAGQYVNKNCGDFGFIIRYPLLKEKETGFSYEPWHIRYVGLPHSQIIVEKSVSLEEYIAGLELDCAYSYGDYIITRQDGEKVIAPSEYESVTVSPDNLGNLIFAFKIK